MEAIQSNRGLTALEYVFVALPIALLLSVYLLGDLAIAGRHNAPTRVH